MAIRSGKTFFARRKAGLYSKRAGDWFETWLKNACNAKGWAALKIPSGCEWVAHNRAKPVKTPFDFVFCKNGVSIFGDAKTTNEKAFGFSKITPHQLAWLEYIEKAGNISGYIVNFRELNQTVFFSTALLSSLRPRCSLSPSDGIMIGSNNEIDLQTVAAKYVHEKS
jgi:hypothetical protein